jgi:hypothetical protein
MTAFSDAEEAVKINSKIKRKGEIDGAGCKPAPSAFKCFGRPIDVSSESRAYH